MLELRMPVCLDGRNSKRSTGKGLRSGGLEVFALEGAFNGIEMQNLFDELGGLGGTVDGTEGILQVLSRHAEAAVLKDHDDCATQACRIEAMP